MRQPYAGPSYIASQRRLRGSRRHQVRIGLFAGGRWIPTIGPWHERAGFCCGRRITGTNGAAKKGCFLRGTDGSNPSPSSGESIANLTSSIMTRADRERLGWSTAATTRNKVAGVIFDDRLGQPSRHHVAANGGGEERRRRVPGYSAATRDSLLLRENGPL